MPYMALGIWLIWVFVLNSGTAWLSDVETDGTNISVLYIAACSAIGAFLLLSSLLPGWLAERLSSSMWVIGGAAVSAVACFVVIAIGPYYLKPYLEEWAIVFLFCLGSFLGGAGSVPLLLRCAEMYGRLTPRHAILYTAFSHIVAALTYFVIVGAPSWAPVEGGPSLAGMVAFIFLPLIAAFLACLPFEDSESVAGDGRAADASLAGAGEAHVSGGPASGMLSVIGGNDGHPVREPAICVSVGRSLEEKSLANEMRKFLSFERAANTLRTKPFKKLAVIVFAFSLVIAVVRAVAVQSSPVEQTYEVTRLAMLLRMVAATVFACAAVAADAKVFNFGKIYSVVMTATVVVVVLLPFVDVFHAITGSFVLLIAFIFDFLLWCVLSFVIYQNHSNSLWVVGRAYGCSYLGTTVGWALGAYVFCPILDADAGAWGVWLALALIVLASAFVLFSEKEFGNLFESTEEGGESLEELLEEDIAAAPSYGLQEGEAGWFEHAVEMLADDNGLTEREREVMRCLAHGYSVSAVARSLQVSRNTARNHCSSIYSKLDVHSKQEVIDKVNALRQVLRKK